MLKNNFCSSPWIHLRINYNGDYSYCRWGKDTDFNFLQKKSKYNIKTHSLLDYYNSDEVKTIRKELLAGSSPESCSICQYEEKFGKINGRIRQLNKSGIDLANFEKTIRSSPHYDIFLHSYQNEGHSNYQPVDLQIDLGNICNSACIMCDPIASSRLASDYDKLNQLENTIFKKPLKYDSWTNNNDTVNNLIASLSLLDKIKYIHFLGGETLYDNAFYSICNALIDNKLSSNIIIGTTTNGTIFNNDLEKIIGSFKEFHLGISIESVGRLNDYIRWPSDIENIKLNLLKFLELRERYPGLVISLRITPNLFSIYELDKLIEFQMEYNIIAESCNIMYEPDCLVMEILPEDIRNESITKLENVIEKYNFVKNRTVNIRRQDLIKSVIADTTIDYYNFLKDYIPPEDTEQRRYKLVRFLKSFESIRNNSVLDYIPRYEKFLRSYGY